MLVLEEALLGWDRWEAVDQSISPRPGSSRHHDEGLQRKWSGGVLSPVQPSPAQPSPAQPGSGGSVGVTDVPLQSAIVDTRRQQKLVITIMMLIVLLLGWGARMLIHNHFLTLMVVILVFMTWQLDITGHVGQWE